MYTFAVRSASICCGLLPVCFLVDRRDDKIVDAGVSAIFGGRTSSYTLDEVQSVQFYIDGPLNT